MTSTFFPTYLHPDLIDTFTTFYQQEVGHLPDGELIAADDDDNPATITYITTDDVEHGRAHPTWGITTWHQEEQVTDTAEANTLADLLHQCAELDQEGAIITTIEIPADIAAELHYCTPTTYAA